jgi:hypothetical protein
MAVILKITIDLHRRQNVPSSVRVTDVIANVALIPLHTIANSCDAVRFPSTGTVPVRCCTSYS